MEPNVSFPAFLLTYYIVTGVSAFESSSSDAKTKFGMDKLSPLSKLLFGLLSGVLLIKQIESLSFSIDSVQQTDPTVYAY